MVADAHAEEEMPDAELVESIADEAIKHLQAAAGQIGTRTVDVWESHRRVGRHRYRR